MRLSLRQLRLWKVELPSQRTACCHSCHFLPHGRHWHCINVSRHATTTTAVQNILWSGKRRWWRWTSKHLKSASLLLIIHRTAKSENCIPMLHHYLQPFLTPILFGGDTSDVPNPESKEDTCCRRILQSGGVLSTKFALSVAKEDEQTSAPINPLSAKSAVNRRLDIAAEAQDTKWLSAGHQNANVTTTTKPLMSHDGNGLNVCNNA